MSSTRYRVLLVEDDKVDQLAFTRMIEEQNLPYDVEVCGSVAEGRKALAEGRFDIILADYRLGDGTAFEVLDQSKSIPTIFVTGSGSEEVAVGALRAGAADYLIKDPDRNYLKMMPAIIEHTMARVRAEEQVRKLSKALDQSPVMVMITDTAGRIEYVNPRFTVVTGYNAKDVIGQNPRLLKSGKHGPEFYRHMWDTIKTGRVWRGELQNRKRNGTLFWEQVSISPVHNADGMITHYVAVKEDISERKQAEATLAQSEANFRAVAENARDGILISVGEGRNVYANRRIADISGFSPEELLQKQLWDLAPPEERDRLRELYQRRMRGEDVLHNYETTLVRKDGKRVPVELSTAMTVWRGQPAALRLIRDITERQRAEQALRESEEKYRSLVERAGDGIAIIQDNVIRLANRRLAEMSGWSEVDAVGTPFIEYIRPDERAKVVTRYQQRMRGEDVPKSYETTIRRKDGSSVDVELNAGVVTYHGRPADLVIIRDVTARKQAEADLASREARLRMMVEQVPAILWTTDIELTFTSSVGAALPKLGLVPGQLDGTKLGEFFKSEDPQFAPIAAHQRALKGVHSTFVFELGGNAYDSDVEPLYDSKGRIIGTIGVAQDITRMVQVGRALEAEKDRAQKYLDIAGVMLVVLDSRGNVQLINKRGCEVLGRREDDIVGRNWFDTYVLAGERPVAREAFERLMAGQGGGSEHHEGRVVAADGAERVISWHSTALQDDAGTVIGTLGSGEDVTEEKRAVLERETLIHELDAFSHTVAHDLNGPLTSVLGFAELLRGNTEISSRPDLKENVDLVCTGAEKMQTIVKELLTLAGVRKADVQLKPVDMAGIVNDAWQRLSYLIDEHHPEIVFPERWPPTLGHAAWLEEVWANYLSNAIKYGGRPPRLEIGAERAGSDRVRYWVRDNGPGLAPEEVQRLFIPFNRLHQVRATGQGLGLSIVRRIIEKLGGEAWVESEPGHGSTFGFTLPVASGPDQPSPPRPSGQRVKGSKQSV